MQKVNELKYFKSLVKFKEFAKKAILSLKNSERQFFADETKIMRMMIKFEANGLRNELDHFCQQSQGFSALKSDEFLRLSFNDSVVHKSIEDMQNLFNIDLD